MSDNILEWSGTTILPIPCEKVLEKALEKDLEEVIVVGHTKDNDIYIATSNHTWAQLNWLIDKAKMVVLE